MAARAIEVTFPGGLRVNARLHNFTIPTDQPLSSGGEGTAPSPFDLFLASIATCAGYYVLAFCRQRNIPPEKISLEVQALRGAESHMIDKVRILIRLPAGFPEKYRTAVVKAADACSVKAHLLRPPVFEIEALGPSS